MAYGVLIVDDSAFMRVAMSKLFATNPNFEVVGIARNGLDAIERVKQLKPNVVTMDVEMPRMDGLTAVHEIMEQCPVPIVMVSSLVGKGTDMAVQALHAGAVDCFLKDELLANDDAETREQFFERLEAAARANVDGRVAPVATMPTTSISPITKRVRRRRNRTEAIIIGCSTGGPNALQSILPRLTKPLSVPVMVVQHMPPGFTKSLAERFARICPLPVKEAENGEEIRAGHIYIAPAGLQTTIEVRGSHQYFTLSTETPIPTRFRPSVDVMLLSAAPIFRDRLLVAILTGMGNDGTLGCERVKSYQGHVLTQSSQSCVVYGMPKSVDNAGLSDEQLSLDEMAPYMLDFVAEQD